MNGSISDNRTNFDRLLNMKNNLYVKIGVQEGTKHRDKTGTSDLVNIAAANEFGTERIPSRPFMRTTFEKNVENINKLTEAYYKQAIDGEGTLEGGLEKIGFFMEREIKKAIVDWSEPPNAESTQLRKGNKKNLPPGTKVNDPLVDTGQLVQSIRFVVVNNGV